MAFDQVSDQTGTQNDDFGKALSALRDLSFVVAIALFFLGFNFERDFLVRFGIRLLPETSITSFVAFSYDAFAFAGRSLKFYLIADLVLAFVAFFAARLAPWEWVRWAVIFVFAILSFPLLAWSARDAAAHSYLATTGAQGVPVAIIAKSSAKPEKRKHNHRQHQPTEAKENPLAALPTKVQAANDNCVKGLFPQPGVKPCRLRIVYEDSDRTYVFFSGAPGATGVVWPIMKDDDLIVVRTAY